MQGKSLTASLAAPAVPRTGISSGCRRGNFCLHATPRAPDLPAPFKMFPFQFAPVSGGRIKGAGWYFHLDNPSICLSKVYLKLCGLEDRLENHKFGHSWECFTTFWVWCGWTYHRHSLSRSVLVALPPYSCLEPGCI